MSIEEIMSAIRSLAGSQGFYGRLYNELWEMQTNDPDQWEEVKNTLEAQNFNDTLDIVMYFET